MRHIDKVIARNQEVGGSFFDSRTVLYFKNKVLPTMYGEKYFISYDLTEDAGKVFNIREVLPSGLIKMVGDLGGYASLTDAKAAIRTLLRGLVTA